MTDDEFNLTPSHPASATRPAQAVRQGSISQEQKSKLALRVTEFVDDLVSQDANSPEFGRRVDQIIHLGRREIADAAGRSNRFLDRPTEAMEETSGVGADLVELRRAIEDLDPFKRGNLLAPRKLFGLIPFGDNLRRYFNAYKSAQSHIGAILARLQSGKDELLRDNAAIDVERQNLWVALGRVEQMIFVSQALDDELQNRAAVFDASDPGKAKAIRETALFYVRQRTQDLMTQAAVSTQGYLALDLVKKNNIELIKGVDRASTTTVGALRTAVTVAQALSHQKLVLDQIAVLNTTTANIIDGTGQMLRDNTAQTHQQAASATVSIETLRRAFQNIYDVMDKIDAFKLQALDGMKQTVSALEAEIDRSKAYIAVVQGERKDATDGRDAHAPGLLEILD
ncbi:MAG: toxic anion resistance protein [Methylocystis sp.]|uniref:toxic anion resistance protein n=1 Tax=Methylocystis sp. TaxID=1911079 RepID=UPI003D10D946